MVWKQTERSMEFDMFCEYGYNELTAAALYKAGIRSLEKAKEYLSGDTLHSPSLIRNIELATNIIWDHIYQHNKICVFGDYDADGITASAIMFLALKRLGANVSVRLPDRIEEGYGISKKAIDDQIDVGARLFITVDNGIRAVEETAYIKTCGCDIVILDHHEPGETLPEADALIDLHIPGETYPFIELTGAALAWKVAHYMLEQVSEHDYAMSLVDLAAMGTIGDVAPLHDENRVIVKRAIKRMRHCMYDRPGVAALMKDMEHITAEDIAFRLAPCLNASGRLNSRGAELPLILLLEDNPKIAQTLAERVNAENERRKKLQAYCYEQIRTEAVKRIANGEKVLVLLAENAPCGVAGLLAGNLKEEFNRPAIVLCTKKDLSGQKLWTGSARSIDAFHMLKAIESCGKLLYKFGGHRLAAGISMLPEDALLEQFREAMNQQASELDKKDLEQSICWDIELSQEELTDDLYAGLEELEPFGAGAPKPVILMPVSLSEDKSHDLIGQNREHLKLYTKDFSLIGFSLADKYIRCKLPQKISVVGCPSKNNYRGQSYKQITILDFTAA
ncbi:MAG TPA: single-stranded-DNA-specific exonuclease RecJ [Ruminococcaceae bacterium]|nr:single-stranded-DNA-specific exonuclease RecJ [Oscillospiraceae bacterium]